MNYQLLLDEVVQNLEADGRDIVRIKKLLYCVCKSKWNQDINEINNINLKDLIQELWDLSPTLVYLKYLIYRIVIRLNRSKEYVVIADLIIKGMEKLYTPAPQPAPKVSITDDSTHFVLQSAANQQGSLVILRLEDSNLEQGVRAILEIIQPNGCIHTPIVSWLPLLREILENYDSWQSTYRNLNVAAELTTPETSVNKSEERLQETWQSAEKLKLEFSQLYQSGDFSTIREKLLKELDENEEITLIIRTLNPHLWQLPWHVVFEPFLNRYHKAELALSIPEPERIVNQPKHKKKLKILAIFGNSAGINLEEERKFLDNLPNSEALLITEPKREELDNKFWEQGWDILFFSSYHVHPNQKDSIYINKSESLTMWALKYALTKAVVRGLKLAILNFGDGLDLAQEMASLHIPEIIFMQQPMPTSLAKDFLKLFLKSFVGGKSLYASVRQARSKLQSLENVFPGASWLPVICQDAAKLPVTWQEVSLPVKNQSKESFDPQIEEPITDLLRVETILNQKQPPQTSSFENIYLANTLSGFLSEVYAVALSPDGHTLVSGSGDIEHQENTIKIWNLDTGSLINTLTGHLHWVYSIAISPDGLYIVSGSFDSTIKIWNLATGTLKPLNIDCYNRVNTVAITPDGHKIVSGSDDSTIKIWDFASGTLMGILSGHSRAVNGVAITTDGQKIVSGSDDRNIKIWDLATHTLVNTLTGHNDRVYAVAISPDGQKIISGSDDKTIKIWKIATGTLIGTLAGHEKSVNALAISPDGQTIFSGSVDKTIKIWNLDTKTLITTLTGHDSAVFCLAISRDGSTLVSGSYGEIKIWRGLSG